MRNSFHTANVGTILVPNSPIATSYLFLYTKTCVFLTLMPPAQPAPKPNCRRRVPERLDPVVHLQLSSWSLVSGDSSGCFDRSSVPAGFLPQTDIDNTVTLIAQAGRNAESHAHTCCRAADNPQQCVHYRIQVDTGFNIPMRQHLI